MFILRSIHKNDLASLYELSKIQNFINLPSKEKILEDKIDSSLKSFKNPSQKLEENYYIFVLEDTVTKKIVGTSMIHGRHGTAEEPHFYLKVGTENKYSETMHVGYIHKTLKLGIESEGWSEIGGLILDPSFRGHKDKLGKQLSYIRFLYMTLYPERFTPIIHTELMPPFDEKGNSPLWEAIGRRFMHMDYDDADQRSRKNKEFILSLYPSDTIYETLLPLEARQSIGEVGETTKPVKKMLENIGFQYTNEVDPFDGGPHYRANLRDISLVKDSVGGILAFSEIDSSSAKECLIALEHPSYDFFALKAKVHIDKEENKNKLVINEKLAKNFQLAEGYKAQIIYF